MILPDRLLYEHRFVSVLNNNKVPTNQMSSKSDRSLAEARGDRALLKAAGMAVVKSSPITPASLRIAHRRLAAASRVRKSKPRRARDNKPNLSATALAYVQALANPKSAPLVGVPSSWPIAPSFKARSWCIGTTTIGGGGVGFVMVAPLRTYFNDANSVYTSSQSYGLAALPTTFVEAGVVSNQTNATYSSSDIAAGNQNVQARLVGCAATIKYTGTELNLSGEVIALRHPDNQALTGGLTASQLLQYPNAVVVPMTSKRPEVRVVWLPLDSTDVDYGAGSTTSPISMAFHITGASNSTYHYEVFNIYEIIGPTIPARSASHSDPVGLAAVISAAESSDASWWGSAKSTIVQLTKSAAREFITMSGHAVANAVGGGMGFTAAQIAHMVSPSPSLPSVTVEEIYDELVGPIVLPSAAPTLDSIPWKQFMTEVKNGEITVLAWEPHIIVRVGAVDYNVVVNTKNHIVSFNPISASSAPKAIDSKSLGTLRRA